MIEVLVNIELSVVSVSDPYNDKLTAGFLDRLEVYVILPCRNVYAESSSLAFVC